MAKDRTLGLKLKAVDKISRTLDKVSNKFPKLTRSIQRASRFSKIFNAQTKQMRATLQKVGGGLKSFGKAVTLGVTLPFIAAAAAGLKMFGDFEQGLKGIEKTTGIAGPELEKLGKTFDDLSTTIPVSSAEMLELAQAGGQLGIKGVKNIEKFTVVMAKLSRASDVAGEDGAKAIARILTVTGTGIDKIDRFSSTLVDLGNNAAASESEILEVATRVAGQVGRFDVASDKVLGISTALKSLGKNAEAAGSVVGKSFDAIDQAIKGGGKKFQLLSRLSGISTKDLKKNFQKDAAGVFQKFVEGLGKVQKGGGNMVKVMGALGLQGVRINDILGTLAKRPEVLAKNMDRASKAFQKNTALEKEFAIQTKTFNSSMIVISNTFKSLLKLMAAELAPAVEFFGKVFKKVMDFLRRSPIIRTLVVVFGALLAVLGPLAFAFGTFLVILPALTAGIGALSVASLPITGTVLAIVASIAALVVVSIILIKQWDRIKSFFKENIFAPFLSFITQVTNAITNFVEKFNSLEKIKNIVAGFLPESFREGLRAQGKLGPESGAKAVNKSIGQAKQSPTDPFNGVLDVNFNNAPKGTNVKAKTQGPLDFNLGFAGGIQ